MELELDDIDSIYEDDNSISSVTGKGRPPQLNQ